MHCVIAIPIDFDELCNVSLTMRYDFPLDLLSFVAMSHVNKSLPKGDEPLKDTLVMSIASGYYPEVLRHCRAVEARDNIPPIDNWVLGEYIGNYFVAFYRAIKDYIFHQVSELSCTAITLVATKRDMLLIGVSD